MPTFIFFTGLHSIWVFHFFGEGEHLVLRFVCLKRKSAQVSLAAAAAAAAAKKSTYKKQPKFKKKNRTSKKNWDYIFFSFRTKWKSCTWNKHTRFMRWSLTKFWHDDLIYYDHYYCYSDRNSSFCRCDACAPFFIASSQIFWALKRCEDRQCQHSHAESKHHL